MRRLSLVSILPLLSVLLTIGDISQVTPAGRSLVSCLPVPGELKEWERSGATEIYKGEELYLWIDGGASIYFEYGFTQVIAQRYKNPEGQVITLELYEMADPQGAYGIYTFKRGSEDSPASVGQEGSIGDYYLNFWKGDYAVTLAGSNPEELLTDNLLAIGRIVEKRLPGEGSRPPLIDLLPEEGLNTETIKYLRGPLALLNCHSFGGDDAFALKEGVAADYGSFKLLIFQYGDIDESLIRFNSAREHLSAEEGNAAFADGTDLFSYADEGGHYVHLRRHLEYLLIAIGEEDKAPDIHFKDVEEKIAHSHSQERG